MKRCGRCHRVKPLDDFYVATRQPDGHRYCCQDCDRERVARRYRKRPPRTLCCASCGASFTTDTQGGRRYCDSCRGRVRGNAAR